MYAKKKRNKTVLTDFEIVLQRQTYTNKGSLLVHLYFYYLLLLIPLLVISTIS